MTFLLIFVVRYFQVYSDCLSPPLHENLPEAYHMSATVFGLVYIIPHNGTSAIRSLGHRWLG